MLRILVRFVENLAQGCSRLGCQPGRFSLNTRKNVPSELVGFRSMESSVIWEPFCHRDSGCGGIWNIENLKSEDVTAQDVVCGWVKQDGHCFGYI